MAKALSANPQRLSVGFQAQTLLIPGIDECEGKPLTHGVMGSAIPRTQTPMFRAMYRTST
eukprot:2737918-Karenia_brevis.AAC.1